MHQSDDTGPGFKFGYIFGGGSSFFRKLGRPEFNINFSVSQTLYENLALTDRFH